MKCTINGNNEITSFWTDESAPENAIDCDTGKTIHGTGSPINQTLLYKLVDGVVTPTEAGIAWIAQEYARNRATEYPAIADQLDEIFHNGLDSWRAIIQQTKDKYSKE